MLPLHLLGLLSCVLTSLSCQVGALLIVAGAPGQFQVKWRLHLMTPPEGEQLFSKNSSKSLGPGMAQSTLGYMPTCNQSPWAQPGLDHYHHKAYGQWCGSKELERGKVGFQIEKNNYFWKKREGMLTLRNPFYLTICKSPRCLKHKKNLNSR